MDDVLKTTAKTCKHGSFLVFLPGGRSLVGFWGLRYPSPVKTNMDFLVKRTWRRDESSKGPFFPYKDIFWIVLDNPTSRVRSP